MFTASAQTEVTPFTPGSTLEGVNYFLPRTALRIVVEVEKTEVTPGDLSKYAYRYLRLEQVPSEPSTNYSIKSIKVEPYGVVDPSKAYSIKVKSKTVAPLVTLTPEGILLAINKTTAAAQQRTGQEDKQGGESDIDPRSYMSQEILTAGSTSKMAELCAQEIYDIREARNALTRGEADNLPKDGEQLRLMLNKLDEQAAALESLFKGRKKTTLSTHELTFIPEEEKEVLLFRFSQKLGVVDVDDLSGTPVFISLTPQGALPARQDDPSVEKKKAKMEKGIYYNVPVREHVRIYDVRHTYCETEQAMGQFGSVEVLSDMLFNKNVTTSVTFYPETGGVEKLEQ